MLIQFARVELERPDALVWMQNGKFYEIYRNVAHLMGRLLDLRVAEKPLMTGRDRQPFGPCDAADHIPVRLTSSLIA